VVRLVASLAGLLAVIACASSSVAQTETQPGSPAAPDSGWQLVWSDEFEGNAIDRAKWGFDVDCWGGGNEERQCYTARPENAFVADGKLNIVARREAAQGPALPPHLEAALPERQRGKTAVKPFTSARLTTRGKSDWTYGRFEVRAKAPQGQGTWSAAWMLPTTDHYGAWAASGEIDIMEVVNNGAVCRTCSGGVENRIFGTIHYGGEWPRNRYRGEDTEVAPTEDGFHVYAVEWKLGEIKWFVDGRHYLTLTQDDWASRALFSSRPRSAPFDKPFHLILNLAIGGHLAEDNNARGVDVTGFPKTLEIDWVRVYQRPDTAVGG